MGVSLESFFSFGVQQSSDPYSHVIYLLLMNHGRLVAPWLTTTMYWRKPCSKLLQLIPLRETSGVLIPGWISVFFQLVVVVWRFYQGVPKSICQSVVAECPVGPVERFSSISIITKKIRFDKRKRIKMETRLRIDVVLDDEWPRRFRVVDWRDFLYLCILSTWTYWKSDGPPQSLTRILQRIMACLRIPSPVIPKLMVWSVHLYIC